MTGYLIQFSDSFVMAILLWPFLAAFLTLPILLMQYFKYRRLVISRIILAYCLMLYVLALVAFTLYPFPSDPIVFCKDYNLTPQLNILQFINDIKGDGLRAIFQIVMNVVFFVPLGIFARNYLGWRLGTTILVGFLTSLTIECAQLTGAFGLYPCSYRLFDVGDLVANALGAIIGFCFGFILPKFTEVEKGLELTTEPGLVRRLVILIIDVLFMYVIVIFCLAIFYIFIGNEATIKIRPTITLVIFVIYQFLTPLFWQGKTLVGYIAHTSLDNKKRGWLWRTLLYITRATLLGLFMLVEFHPWLQPILFILVLAYWKKTKTPLYALVDELFTEKKPKKDTAKK